jgi:hypothetical protein
MQDLKQSTAAVVEIGPILNVDGTPYVTDDLVYTDFRLRKNDTPAAKADAAVAHVAGDLQGMFAVTVTTGDTDMPGRWTLVLNKATLAAAPIEKMVLPANVYDALVAGSDKLDVAGMGMLAVNQPINHGSTGNILRIYVPNLDGTGKTDLAYNTATLSIGVRPNNAASPTVYAVTSDEIEDVTTAGTYEAPTAGKCRLAFTGPPGWHEIHLSDAWFATVGATSLTVTVFSTTNSWRQSSLEVPLVGVPHVNVSEWGGAAVGAMPNTTTPPTADEVAAATVEKGLRAIAEVTT